MNQPLNPSLSQSPNAVKVVDKRLIRIAGLAGLSAFVFASRIPYTSKVLYHWDSVNFAYAMSEFNLVKEQPQPPGYIVYVWLCRLLDVFFHDPQQTMVAISLIASVGAVIAMFLLGEAMYNQRVGWLSASFLAASPLFWFYNEIALPHTVDAFLVIVTVLFLYKSMQGERKYVFPAVIFLAIAGGVRQQTVIFLAPVMLYAFRKIGWKYFLGAGFAGLVICLAWFIPLISMSGGLKQYLAVMGSFSNRFQETTSVFMGAGLWGIRRNVTKLIFYSAFGWSIFFIPVFYFAFSKLSKLRRMKLGERSIFIGLWMLPGVLFYLLIHMGQQGLVFVFLPALILMSGAALDAIFLGRLQSLVVSGLGLILLSSAIFLFLPEYPFGPGSQRLLTRQTLSNSDQYFLSRLTVIKNNFDPQNTLIVAENWHHVQYYLPGYQVIPFNLGAKWEVDAGIPASNPNAGEHGTPSEWGLKVKDARIVVFDPPLADYAREDTGKELIQMIGEEPLLVLGFPAQGSFFVNADSFGVEDK